MKHAKLYETHVNTTNLERAISFYESLGLKVAHKIDSRRVAFFYLGEEGSREQMLGVWEVCEAQFTRKHFAFYVDYNELMTIPTFFNEIGVELRPDFDLDITEPIVHAWMPAACYYFQDPDGNSLEYLTLLEGEPQPELGTIHLSEWYNKIKEKNTTVR
jgi:lactoylglutathione lyase